jgi:hypothetical protein
MFQRRKGERVAKSQHMKSKACLTCTDWRQLLRSLIRKCHHEHWEDEDLQWDELPLIRSILNCQEEEAFQNHFKS